MYTLESEYAHLYPFSRSIYVELPDYSYEAYSRLVAEVLDANKLPTLNYRLELSAAIRGKLDLFDAVKMKYEALDVEVELKVMSVSRKLKERTSDVIEIGIKQKNILDYIAALKDEITNDVYEVNNVVENVINQPAFITTISEVTKHEVLAADNIHASSAFVREMFVEHLTTNLVNFTCIPNLVEAGNDAYTWAAGSPTYTCTTSTAYGDVRPYLDAESIYMKFREARLSPAGNLTALTPAQVEV